MRVDVLRDEVPQRTAQENKLLFKLADALKEKELHEINATYGLECSVVCFVFRDNDNNKLYLKFMAQFAESLHYQWIGPTDPIPLNERCFEGEDIDGSLFREVEQSFHKKFPT